MAALQIQESSGPDVIVTSKGRSLLGTGSGVVPASLTDEPVLVRGNLQKLGKRFKGWHQRYFEIQGSHMYYYKNMSKKECLGEINLTICFHCEPTSAATFGSPFEIKTVQRSHVLAARSKEEMQQWIQVIKEKMSPSESAAKKGGSSRGTTKKSTKPKRWESFKNTFAIKQRSPSPALDSQEQKRTAKKSFMDRFKVKRTGSNQLAAEPQDKRPLSFTGTDENHKDTLDVFRQFEVSKSLPSSPVARRKKQSVPSRESPPPYSPMSMSSGSPFTGGATTEDSQTSTPSHVAAVIADQDARTQQEVGPTTSVVGQEIKIRVDVEDTPSIPIIVEPSEAVEATETLASETSKPAEPVQPVIVVEKEPENVESPAKQAEPAEPVDAIQKETESPTKPAEQVEQDDVVQKEIESPTKPAEPTDIAQEGIESPTKPAEPIDIDQEGKESPTKPADPADSDIVIETETEEEKSPVKVAEPTIDIQKESESPTEPVKPAEPANVIEKEPEKPALPAKPAIIPEKEVAERKSKKPALPTKPAAITEKDVERKPDKPALSVKPAAIKEKDAEKPEKPTLPVKPASIKKKETERKSAKPALPAKPATVTEKESEPILPAKPVVIVDKETVKKADEPFIPKYLKDRKFQWDRIQEILETAPQSTEDPSYSELPALEATWMEHSSPVEQLRAFLLVCP